MPSIAEILAAAEKAVAELMAKAYRVWLSAARTAVLAPFARFGLPPDPAGIWGTVPLWESQIRGLMSHVAQVARSGWIDAGRQLDVDLPFDVASPVLADQLQRTRNLMVRTPDEVYRMIVAELGRAYAAGEGPQQQAARVERILDFAGVENWESRARTVAVTESHRAWNFGALAAALQAQDGSSLPLVKRWDSRDDTRTRDAHERADGQTVPVSQPFIVDLEALMAPSDPSGSPHNVINCRCKPLFTRRPQ